MNESHDSLRRDYEVSCTGAGYHGRDRPVAGRRSRRADDRRRIRRVCGRSGRPTAAATVVREIVREQYKSATGTHTRRVATGAGAGVGAWPVGASA